MKVVAQRHVAGAQVLEAEAAQLHASNISLLMHPRAQRLLSVHRVNSRETRNPGNVARNMSLKPLQGANP